MTPLPSYVTQDLSAEVKGNTAHKLSCQDLDPGTPTPEPASLTTKLSCFLYMQEYTYTYMNLQSVLKQPNL